MITGKTNLDDLALGLGESWAFGAARNPAQPEVLHGRRFVGLGSAVAAGMVDMALGADEGGSVRIPSTVVRSRRYEGHARAGALIRAHLYGPHGRPHRADDQDRRRQRPDARDHCRLRLARPPVGQERTEARRLPAARPGLSRSPACGWELSEKLSSHPDAGPMSSSLSTRRCPFSRGSAPPSWRAGQWTSGSMPVLSALPCSAWACMGWPPRTVWGFGHLGRIDPLVTAGWAAQTMLQADDLPPLLKSTLVTTEYILDHYQGVPFAKAQNLRLELRRQLMAAMSGVDVLVTPTTARAAFELLDRRARPGEMNLRMQANMGAVANTMQLDLTGHPALTVPCGTGDHGRLWDCRSSVRTSRRSAATRSDSRSKRLRSSPGGPPRCWALAPESDAPGHLSLPGSGGGLKPAPLAPIHEYRWKADDNSDHQRSICGERAGGPSRLSESTTDSAGDDVEDTQEAGPVEQTELRSAELKSTGHDSPASLVEGGDDRNAELFNLLVGATVRELADVDLTVFRSFRRVMRKSARRAARNLSSGSRPACTPPPSARSCWSATLVWKRFTNSSEERRRMPDRPSCKRCWPSGAPKPSTGTSCLPWSYPLACSRRSQRRGSPRRGSSPAGPSMAGLPSSKPRSPLLRTSPGPTW